MPNNGFSDWPTEGLQLPAQKFEARYGGSPGGGIIGGGGIFYGIVTFEPLLKFFKQENKMAVSLGTSQVRMEVIEKKEPTGLAILGWSMDLIYANYPEQAISNVQLVFDVGPVKVSGDYSSHSANMFTIPPNSTKLLKLEFDFTWIDKVNHFVFEINANVGIKPPKVVSIEFVDNEGKALNELKFDEPFRIKVETDTVSENTNFINVEYSVANNKRTITCRKTEDSSKIFYSENLIILEDVVTT